MARARLSAAMAALLVVVLLQGALRKWVAPGQEEALFFAHVPVLAYVYWQALAMGSSFVRSRGLMVVLLFGYGTFCQLLLQLLLGGYSLRHALIGVYGWFLLVGMIPAALQLPRMLDHRFAATVAKILSWIALVSLPLVVMQFSSPPGSVWNAGTAVGEGRVFEPLTVALGVSRTTGLQTSAAGQGQFLASAAATLIGVLIGRRRLGIRVPKPLLYAGLGAIAIMVPLSGSRGVLFLLALVVIAGLLAAVLSNAMPFRLIAGLSVGAVSSFLLWVRFAPNSLAAFSERWANASRLEQANFGGGTVGRALYNFHGFVDYLGDTPPLGYLVGIAGNAASRLSWVRRPLAAEGWLGPTGWAEDSWSAHIVEFGPTVGLMIILGRISIVLYLAYTSYRAARVRKNPVPMVLFGYVGPSLLFGQITQQGTTSTLAWFMTGVLVVTLSTDQARVPKLVTAREAMST